MTERMSRCRPDRGLCLSVLHEVPERSIQIAGQVMIFTS
jgi:hypothetical protein